MSSNAPEVPLRPIKLKEIPPEDEIVISGIAGRFPESDNVKELQENLLNKADLITDDERRWKLNHPQIPNRTAKVNNIEKFDALFFGVHAKQADPMDPMARMLLEHAYEAVVDAGFNPRHLRKSRTAVFIAACGSESEKPWFYDDKEFDGYGVSGTSRSMFANRISYALDLVGLSFAVDTACSSGMCALENAYRCIRDGYCDAAIVGGTQLCLNPKMSLQFFKFGILSPDGIAKAFDESADGYVRGECISAIFLQKAKDARRIYATVKHVKGNCDGFKEEGINFPSTHMQTHLLREFYIECGISPTNVDFVEAHGTGTAAGDPEEANAIDKFYTPGRSKPLLIGSVKSNVGHAEGASAMNSIAKVIIAMETGVIPPNLHFKRPNPSIKGIIERRMKVVTEPTPWKGGYTAINSFGFGGANYHALLHSHTKEKIKNGAPSDELPRLVAVSGRTEEAVSTILSDLESRPVDVEYIKLLHDIYAEEMKDHLFRGYTVLPAHGISKTPKREIQSFAGSGRPVVFVFSGMGSQWPGMGKTLLQIPVFYEAIRQCDEHLKPYKIDIFDIITNEDKTAFDKTINSFVGISAVQLGLIDVVKSIGIVPDYIIGHSAGELACGYADGCLTLKQMILSAYFRGKASADAKTVFGAMAAVGLGYEDLKDICPKDIEIACHNSKDSATLSGPADSMKTFIAELQAKNIFAREVPCSNVPYHSRYIAPVGAELFAYLKKVIPDPKPRTKRWLSTSVPLDKWDTPAARLSSPEYYTNNLISYVLFEEASRLLPKDAVAIEIAPHGLLQAILRRSLDPSVTNISVTQRNSDNLQVFLQSVGKMFMAGLHPQTANLYPAVAYPVSRSTPMISPLIKWEHSKDWFVTSYKQDFKNIPSERVVAVSLSGDQFKYIDGHMIDGRILFPATGYLLSIWDFFATMQGTKFDQMSVVFEDVKFQRATTIPKDGTVDLVLVIQKGSGMFEISEGGAEVVSGKIRSVSNAQDEKIDSHFCTSNQEEEAMTSCDVYKELRLRGYQYGGMFQSMKSASITGTKGHIIWRENWCAFMDNMLQISILSEDTRGLFVPTFIKKIVIDPKQHMSLLITKEEEPVIPVYNNRLHDVIISGGIEMRGLRSNPISRRKPAGEPVLEEYKFVPYIDNSDLSLCNMGRIVTQICLENIRTLKMKVVELVEEADRLHPDKLISPFVYESCCDTPLIEPNITLLCTEKCLENNDLPSYITVINPAKASADGSSVLAIGHRLLTNEHAKNLDLLLSELRQDGFIISREDMKDFNTVKKIAENKNLDIILVKKCMDEMFVLLKRPNPIPETVLVVKVNNQDFQWIKTMQNALREVEKRPENSVRVVFLGQGDFENGLLGLVNCLRQEPGGEVVRGIMIQDSEAPEFSLNNPLYINQIKKDLVVSVLRKNSGWGSYKHLSMPALKPEKVPHSLITQMVRGDISSLAWVEGPIQMSYDENNAIHISYAALNFKDVMIASGKIPVEVFVKDRLQQEFVLGMEFSGVDKNGKRIMGLLENKGMANVAVADPDFTFDVPDNFTLEEAATLPVIYATCLYGLFVQGRMKQGEKVLIHAGTGGIGQAAINICLHNGCEVFTTVGTPEKRRFIHEQFPQIRDDHIGNSRDTSFEQMIKKQTNGRGVDIVLNSLSDEKLQASLRCLAFGGRFLEIGKYDLMNDSQLGMLLFLRKISFQAVLLDAIFNEDKREKKVVKKLIEEGLRNGSVKPLRRTVFQKDQVEAAFRYMASGKHIGKVLIKIREDKESLNTPVEALPRFYGLKERSYIVLGGLGGFGLELVDWLILRGVRNVVITSRTGVKTGYQKSRLNTWQKYGAQITVISGKDVSKREDCQYILQTAIKYGPVDGIFNLAAVLKDALWENQTPELFEESFCGKARTMQHLDSLTRKHCPFLRYFVVFSSMACGRGNASQTNYGMSNSVMERICEKRVSEGLPGLAIQWGAIGEVGLVANMMQEENKELVIGGTLQQRISSCLQVLDHFLRQKEPIVASMVVAEKKAHTSETKNVVDAVLDIMSLKDLKGVSLTTSLAELGMDSMMGVEIKQTLEREFDIFLNAQDIRNLTFAKLQEFSSDNKSSTSKPNDDESSETKPTDSKQLVHFIGKEIPKSETCLKLQTRSESSENPVFLIPGIEGFALVFEKLAQKIKLPTNCLQYGTNLKAHASIFDIAEDFLPYVLKNIKKSGELLIVGYSYGALIAIEIVRKLEAKKIKCRLILIDGAPEQAIAMKREEIGTNKDADYESKALLSIITSGLFNTSSKFPITELDKCKNLEDKIEICVKYVLEFSKVDLPSNYLKALFAIVYNRLKILDNHNIAKMQHIKTAITLFKPMLSTIRSVSEDYGLSQVTDGEVKVYIAEGDHFTLLNDDKIARAINGESIGEKV